MNEHLLSIVLFTPLAGMLVLLFLPASNKNLIRVWANLVALAGFLVSLPLVWRYDKAPPDSRWWRRRTGSRVWA